MSLLSCRMLDLPTHVAILNMRSGRSNVHVFIVLQEA